MATAQQTRKIAQKQRFVLHNISWKTYESLLADHENTSAPRFTYDRGDLEIMSPRPEHEEMNRAVALLVELVAAELEIDTRNLGSTTFRSEDLERGFEPDSCFYIQNASALKGKQHIDLRVDPPPDLVIEVDITHSSIDKFALFSSFGVPEVWRFDGAQLAILHLTEGTYVLSETSLGLHGVTAESVMSLISKVESTGRVAWIRSVQEFARGLPRQ